MKERKSQKLRDRRESQRVSERESNERERVREREMQRETGRYIIYYIHRDMNNIQVISMGREGRGYYIYFSTTTRVVRDKLRGDQYILFIN